MCKGDRIGGSAQSSGAAALARVLFSRQQSVLFVLQSALKGREGVREPSSVARILLSRAFKPNIELGQSVRIWGRSGGRSAFDQSTRRPDVRRSKFLDFVIFGSEHEKQQTDAPNETGSRTRPAAGPVS